MKTSDEREKLESLLNEVPDKINGEVPVPGNVPEELRSEPTIGLDLKDLRSTCADEARIMISNAISFILPKQEEMTEDQKAYINNKMNVDVMSLSGMIYQLRVNEAMQKAMVEEVDRGFIHPRMFEVFGQLSKTIGELNKQLLQTVEAIKSTYKDIKVDAKEMKNEAIGPAQNPQMLTAGDGSMTTMGTKELIRKIKEANKVDKLIQDASIIG